MSIPILATKLYIPPPRPQLVTRERLTTQLDDGLRRKLTLISAPPGFGKTTLLSAWVHNADSLNVAWVSLDEADNDPTRFWHYLLAAIDKAQPGLVEGALTFLQAPQPPPIETVLTTLINTLVNLSEPLVLALDDYHLIETEAIHTGLTFLLDHLPPQVHLYILSRMDLPFPLTRLRVRNQLIELRESDLRFTTDEATLFLRQVTGLNLTPRDIAALEARTEGWVAGLQLAALSMQGREDVQSFVAAFTGSHRYIIDYLAEEVLAQQPPAIHDFLLKTSILGRLNGSLCDAVLDNGGEDSAQETLAYLEQGNLFIIPLDDQRNWYRYHHLFADFLRDHLAQHTSPTEIKQLHRRASQWYAEAGLLREAVQHALAAGDVEYSRALIETASMEMLILGETTTVLNWFAALPPETIKNSLRLTLTLGWAKMIRNEWDAVGSDIETASDLLETLSEDPPPDFNDRHSEVITMRAIYVGNRGQFQEAIQLSEEALQYLSADNALGRGIILMNLGTAYEQVGQIERGRKTLQEAIKYAHQSNNLVSLLIATNNLGRIEQEELGHLHDALASYRRSLTLIGSDPEGRQPLVHGMAMVNWAYRGIADVLREQNHLAEARRYLDVSFELSSGEDIDAFQGIAHLILARIQQAEGHHEAAQATLVKARQHLHRLPMPVLWGEAIAARLALQRGDLNTAINLIESLDLPYEGETFNYKELPGEYATLVRVLIAQEESEEALDLLERMQTIAAADGRRGRLLEILMLRALALHAMGQTQDALEPLGRALRMAEPEGFVRLFVDEGRAMAGLLHQAAAAGYAPGYVQLLLDAFPETLPPPPTRATPQPVAVETNNSQLIEPLTDRELEVLGLVAKGHSNQEIGDKLFIAEGTVKKHLHNIFGKLDVRRRAQAIRRARELGLL